MKAKEKRQELMEKYRKMQVVPVNLQMFWAFISERQKIWHRRFVDGSPPPWTNDPILLKYKFTNIYRELDRGTVWLVKNVVEPIQEKDSGGYPWELALDLFWKVSIYRILNRIETFEYAGIPDYAKFDATAYRKKLEAAQKENGFLVSNAHLTLPARKKGQSKLDIYMITLKEFHKMVGPLLSRIIMSARSLEAVWVVCKQIPSCGGFIAYEIVCDLVAAKIIPYTLNDWANAGPGCRFGIKLIFPELAEQGKYLEAIQLLFHMQHEWLKKFNFPYWKGQGLSLRNIEHSLCEFGKYWKTSNNCGKARMGFRPTSTVELYR